MNHTNEENLDQRDRERIETSTGDAGKGAEPAVSEDFAAKAAAFQKLLDSGVADAAFRRASRTLAYNIAPPTHRVGTRGVEQNPWEKPREPVAPSADAPASAGRIPAASGAGAEEAPQALMDERSQIAEEPSYANDEPPQTEEPAVEATDVIVAALETPVEEFPNTVEAHKEELQVQDNNNEDAEPQATSDEEEKPWPFRGGDSEAETDAEGGPHKKHIEVTPLGAGLLGIVEDTARGVGGLGSGCARWLKKNCMSKRRKAGDGDSAEQGVEEDYPWREEGSKTGSSADNLDRSASSAVRVTEKVASSVMAVGAGVGKVAGYVARGAVEGPVDVFRYTWKTVAGITGDIASRLGARKGDSEE